MNLIQKQFTHKPVVHIGRLLLQLHLEDPPKYKNNTIHISINDIIHNLQIYKLNNLVIKKPNKNSNGIYIIFNENKIATYVGKGKPIIKRLENKQHPHAKNAHLIYFFEHKYPNAVEELLLNTFQFTDNKRENTGNVILEKSMIKLRNDKVSQHII